MVVQAFYMTFSSVSRTDKMLTLLITLYYGFNEVEGFHRRYIVIPILIVITDRAN